MRILTEAMEMVRTEQDKSALCLDEIRKSKELLREALDEL